MNEFDLKAGQWDMNPMHAARTNAIAEHILQTITLKKEMSVLEYGAGLIDLEKEPYQAEFDLIVTQMVLHHVTDIECFVIKRDQTNDRFAKYLLFLLTAAK